MLTLVVIIMLTILRRSLDNIEPDHPGVNHITRKLRRCYVGYMESVLVKTLYRDGEHESRPLLPTLCQPRFGRNTLLLHRPG